MIVFFRCSVTAEDLRYGEAESRHHIAALEGVRFSVHHDVDQGTIDSDCVHSRTHHPNHARHARTGLEPLTDLRFNFRNSISRAQHLDRKVWGALAITTRSARA